MSSTQDRYVEIAAGLARDLDHLQELRAALQQIRATPNLGSAYRAMPGREHRRVLMPKTGYHVYYRVVSANLVRVVSVWSAVRGRGPRL